MHQNTSPATAGARYESEHLRQAEALYRKAHALFMSTLVVVFVALYIGFAVHDWFWRSRAEAPKPARIYVKDVDLFCITRDGRDDECYGVERPPLVPPPAWSRPPGA